MNLLDLIGKKKKGEKLSQDEIDFFVHNFYLDRFQDLEVSAFLMAVSIVGLDEEECYYFTLAMVRTGHKIKLPKDGFYVDKNSTGGYSDVVSLIIVPILASFGFKIPKMSSSGYGESAGSLDRLSVFEGFEYNLSEDEIAKKLNDVGACFFNMPSTCVPVDKKLFEFAKKNGTALSLPLIACSIMSKKLILPLDALILDVRCGEGSILSSIEEGLEVGKLMVGIGKRAGIKSDGVVIYVTQPLGRNMGIGLEMREVLKTLAPNEECLDSELWMVCREICTNALIVSGKASGRSVAYEMINKKILSGEALLKFREIVKAQSGDFSKICDEDAFLPDRNISYITAEKKGWVSDVKTDNICKAVSVLGCKRGNNGKIQDIGVGVELFKLEGDKVLAGDKLARVYYSMYNTNFSESIRFIRDSFVIDSKKTVKESGGVIKKIIL